MWYLVVIVVAALVSVALAPKPPELQTSVLSDVDAPTAEEGRPIPVVFGTVLLAAWLQRRLVRRSGSRPIRRKVARNDYADRHHHRSRARRRPVRERHRVWFARHDLDFRAFLRDGCDADILLATGDAMAQRGRTRPQSIQPAGARLMGGSSRSKPSAIAIGWDSIWPCARARRCRAGNPDGRPYRVGDADRAPLSSGHGLTSLSINKPTLFGGDEREGGVVGTIDAFWSCRTRTQRLPDEPPGPSIPAFRACCHWWRARFCLRPTIPTSSRGQCACVVSRRAGSVIRGWSGTPKSASGTTTKAEISVGMNPATSWCNA